MKKKSKIVGEFKEFISRGNVVDLAVGMIIGSSFTAIVNSVVNDLVMPVIGWLFGGINFTTLRLVLREADEAKGIAEASLNYGNFIQNVVNFLLIALVIFTMVKLINRFHRKKEEAPAPAAPAEPPEDVALLREIRDLLKK